MLGAELVGFGAREKDFPSRRWARRGGELPCQWVDTGEGDAFGRLEVSLPTAGDSGFHEARPDGQSGLGAGEAESAVVVMADPDHGEQARYESHKPCVSCVVGSAGLSGGGELETSGPDLPSRSMVDDALHEVGDQIGALGVDDTSSAPFRPVDHLTSGVQDGGHEMRLHLNSSVGDDGVGCSQFERRNFEGAQYKRWVGI